MRKNRELIVYIYRGKNMNNQIIDWSTLSFRSIINTLNNLRYMQIVQNIQIYILFKMKKLKIKNLKI
jgi:hypothetical protein